MNELVLRSDDGPVVTLTLNRPDKLNALSPDLFLELRAHVEAIAATGDNLRSVVLNGAGRSFCAGADLGALRAGIAMPTPEFRSETLELMGTLSQVVIAAVHGHCYTGGLELALTADIIVAADDTRFCDTHAKLGILPRWGMSARLPRRIGVAAAKRLSFTAMPIDAAEAMRVGLCDYVVTNERLNGFANDLAVQISGNEPKSIAGIKHLYDRSLQAPVEDALAYERSYSQPPAPV